VQGVFSLWDGKECVYVGHTPWNRSLRRCLREHLALKEGGSIRASHFSWETTSTPKSRESEVLKGRVERQGNLPRYNLPNSPLARIEGTITDLRAPG